MHDFDKPAASTRRDLLKRAAVGGGIATGAQTLSECDVLPTFLEALAGGCNLYRCAGSSTTLCDLG